MISGYVHSFFTSAAADGPGVRFAVFLSGCPFRCKYCHNPDTWELKQGKLTSSDSILNEIKKYANFLRTAGGLTITGGEPLQQPDFTYEIFSRAKQDFALHTALDTQGFLAKNLPDSYFGPIDLLLLDIKEMNPERHKSLTGQDVTPTLDFAKRLQKMNKKVWLRYVLVPGLTDFQEDIDALAKFIEPLENIERVDVLPFHNMALHKWEKLELPYELKNQRVPTQEETKKVQDFLNKAISAH
ncbi:MAG: pyruvate formate lyase-activating protein [Fibrobacteraceae bacterium]|nr:pyruvate formate lyase-activating protein [Fibrobacteraceae bacterium]